MALHDKSGKGYRDDMAKDSGRANEFSKQLGKQLPEDKGLDSNGGGQLA